MLTGTCAPSIRIFSRISIDLVLAVWRGDAGYSRAKSWGSAPYRPDTIGSGGAAVKGRAPAERQRMMSGKAE